MVSLSIVIPSKDQPELLAGLLEQLAREPKAGQRRDLVVVDTGDGGDGQLAADKFGARVVNAPGASFAVACNKGVDSCQSDGLLLLNNDVRLPRGFLAPAGRLAQQRAITGFRLLYPEGDQTDLVQHAGVGFDYAGNPYNLWQGASGDHPLVLQERYLPAVSFACVAMGREVWWAVDGLDEQFVNAYEDVDFCLRAREVGWPVRYQPAPFAYHFEGRTPGRHDHDAESWALFRARWIDTGRLYYNLGLWPFAMERGA